MWEDLKEKDGLALERQLVPFCDFCLVLGRIYKDEPHPAHQEHVKKLGDYIRFSNEGKPTKAEQLKRVLMFVFT